MILQILLERLKSLQQRNFLYIFFTAHPHANGETWFQHFRKAITYSAKASFAAVLLCIHAIFPYFFKYTAGNILINIGNEIKTKRLEYSETTESIVTNQSIEMVEMVNLNK